MNNFFIIFTAVALGIPVGKIIYDLARKFAYNLDIEWWEE